MPSDLLVGSYRPARLRHILKRPVAFVVEQGRALAFVALRRAVGLVLVIERAILIGLDRPLDVVGDEQVELAVVVIVEPHRAGGESRVGHTGLRGDVGEFAVAQIVEKMIGTDGR